MTDYRQHAQEVYERDGWICKLCGLPVAKDRGAPHPLSPSLDHITAQVLGGGHEPENLQTAHLRCNESKHTRPERGSTLRVVMASPPEVLELLRRLGPEPAEERGEELPELSAETIGDVFDAAVALASTELLRGLPSVEQLRVWIVGQSFLGRFEAETLVRRQIYACLDDRGQCERLRHRLMEELPGAWFIAKFLMEGEGPESPDDENGWDEVAQALLRYLGPEPLEELLALALDGLLVGDPLELLEGALATEPQDDAPGRYRGHPLWAYEEAVRALKAAGRLAECEQLLLGLIGALEVQVTAEGGSLSPHLYEQLAIVRRKMGDDAGELEILKHYFAQPGALDSASLIGRLAKVKARLGRA